MDLFQAKERRHFRQPHYIVRTWIVVLVWTCVSALNGGQLKGDKTSC